MRLDSGVLTWPRQISREQVGPCRLVSTKRSNSPRAIHRYYRNCSVRRFTHPSIIALRTSTLLIDTTCSAVRTPLHPVLSRRDWCLLLMLGVSPPFPCSCLPLLHAASPNRGTSRALHGLDVAGFVLRGVGAIFEYGKPIGGVIPGVFINLRDQHPSGMQGDGI